MPFYKPEYIDYREELLGHLRDVQVMANADRRDSVVHDLGDVGGRVERRTSADDDIRNILEQCARDDAVDTLFARIEIRSGGSRPYRDAYAAWQAIKWKVALIALFPAALSADKEQLEAFYTACRPRTTAIPRHAGLSEATPRLIVDELWRMKDAAGKHTPIVRLALQLARHTPAVQDDVAQWLKDVVACAALPIDNETVTAARQRRPADLSDLSLLVQVIPNDPNDAQRVDVTLFSWSEDRGAERLTGLEPPPNQLYQLPDHLFRVISKAFREQPLARVELFLPLTLISHDITRWIETERGRAVLFRSALVVRLWERQTDNEWAGFAHIDWKQRWQRLREQADAMTEDNVWCFDEIAADLEALQYDLKDSSETLCVLFSFALGAHRQRLPLLHRTILNTGMPVALWPHSDAVPSDDVRALPRTCGQVPLWQHVHRLQQQRDGIGKHLVLLWDDPERQLPVWRSYAPT